MHMVNDMTTSSGNLPDFGLFAFQENLQPNVGHELSGVFHFGLLIFQENLQPAAASQKPYRIGHERAYRIR
jgi:hypothetical protein